MESPYFVQARVVDENGKDVPKDGKTVGELVLRAPWITLGYYGDPEKTRAAFRDGWFHTGGDLATWDERGGFIYIVDRAKDVIKSGGEWISSLKLESLISLHPAVGGEVAVIGAVHEKWGGERPVAIVVLRPEFKGRVKEEDIINHVRKFVDEGVIPKWWVPDKVIFVDELPKTGAAKIDKKVLRDRYRDVLIK
ncbi:AMP-binding protein [Vulcanisaeta distributa]|uniref:AMP-binding enzyme n=1 Tax=Vulcanisaeta distributa TaxID=164451 RepID=UPI000B133009|nr:AMP-binding protein [Vulcanisaeta distributa]